MSIEIRQLKDHNTGLQFAPITQWDAVANKPENLAKVVTLTQNEYDSLEVKDPKTIYIISDAI